MMRAFSAALLLALSTGGAEARTSTPPSPTALPQPADYVPPVPVQLSATTLRRFVAPDADQGVAVDATHFYALDNSVIAKYEIATGRLVGRWMGPNHGLIRHMNSCLVVKQQLICANSNYSLTPMGSSVEIFDTATMKHVDSHSLGMTDEGSITFVEPYQEGWIAGFAQYDDNGGVPFKNHRYANIVTFDAQWRRTGGWLMPDSILARMAPHAASGGSIGPDGLLYILGHDLPEMYVLARPAMGPTLIHVATISLEAEGQAFSWAPGKGRRIFAVKRRQGGVMEIELPTVPAIGPDARPFR